MKHIYRQLIALSLLCIACHADETNQWKDITYVQHSNFKMRIEVFDPPIVLKWGSLVSTNCLSEIQQKAQCLAAKRYFSILDLTYAEWRQYCSIEYLDGFMDESAYSKRKSIDLKKDYPSLVYQNLLYAINYLVDDKEYCIIVSNTGNIPLKEKPENMETFRQKNPISGSLLIKNDGTWKNHSLSQKGSISYRGLLEFANLKVIKEIEKKGFAINGIEHPFVYAFTPSVSLQKAVGRQVK